MLGTGEGEGSGRVMMLRHNPTSKRNGRVDRGSSVTLGTQAVRDSHSGRAGLPLGCTVRLSPAV